MNETSRLIRQDNDEETDLENMKFVLWLEEDKAFIEDSPASDAIQ